MTEAQGSVLAGTFRTGSTATKFHQGTSGKCMESAQVYCMIRMDNEVPTPRYLASSRAVKGSVWFSFGLISPKYAKRTRIRNQRGEVWFDVV